MTVLKARAQIAILCSRENPKIGHRVEPDTSGVEGVRNFRVLMWTEYNKISDEPTWASAMAMVAA